MTDYARASPYEDYAESFANVVYELLYGYGPYGEDYIKKRTYFLEHLALGVMNL
ncbi:MAG: hypothetical protein H6766_04105 [Candidatus Peribacteria bacterium]|nr:MAG: hypothetical protein H6766_04105 [Candidatus Peribacteria bacterium]